MNTFLLTWNPTRHDGESVMAAAHRYADGDSRTSDDWSTTRTRGYGEDDRVYLVAVGVPERGIIASGIVLDPEVYGKDHWSGDGTSANYIQIEWDAAVFLDQTLPVSELLELGPDVRWTPQGGGVLLDPTIADAVEDAWAKHLESLDLPPLEQLEAVADSEDLEVPREYRLALQKVRLHQRRFRQLLLEHYSHSCTYCGTDVLEILEAAHITADSVGGAASVENGRLLCANHHRAYDKGLIAWDDDQQEFYLPEGTPPVPPKPRR